MNDKILTKKEFAELCEQYGIKVYGSYVPRTREKAIRYLEMIKKAHESFEVEYETN